jgi:predicted O-methyltransferase YrrM
MTNINITENSLNIVNEIIKNMEKHTFHNHFHILYDLCENIDKDNITYMEIGTFAGGSASLMSKNQKVKKIVSVDIGIPIEKEIPIKNVNNFKHDNCEYEYIEGDSKLEGTIKKVYDLIKNVDILFIDGDHKYNSVIKDFENYKDLVLPGGFIVFDDYLDEVHSPGVYPAVNDIVNNLDKNKYEIIGSLNYDLIKKTNNPDLKSSNEFIIRKIV